jgi:hypothetical protein
MLSSHISLGLPSGPLPSGFVRSNAGIVGSNPTQGMDVCVYSVVV